MKRRPLWPWERRALSNRISARVDQIIQASGGNVGLGVGHAVITGVVVHVAGGAR